jgi:hypothetical protein
MIDLYEFRSLVDMVATSKPVNNVFTIEDVKQELWVKLSDMNNKGFFLPDCCPTKKDRERLAIRCLRNKLTDIIRSQARRKDTSIYAATDFSMTQDSVGDVLEDHLQSVSCKSHTMSSEEYMDYTELVRLLRTYLEWQQDSRVIKFITEIISTSPEIESRWEALRETKPRYNNLYRIPPQILAEMCGLSKHEYLNVREELSTFLNEEGLENAVI